MTNMANGNWTVYVPDRSQPFTFSNSLTADEVKSALVSTGYTAVENAEMLLSGSVITFRRVTGGTKGA